MTKENPILKEKEEQQIIYMVDFGIKKITMNKNGIVTDMADLANGSRQTEFKTVENLIKFLAAHGFAKLSDEEVELKLKDGVFKV